jgi:cystathionine gamma-synthase
VVLDPTMASPLNLDVLHHADLVVNSLTKFAASSGDVIAGAVIVNPCRPDADALRAAVARHIEPLYSRDLERLAAEIGEYDAVIARSNSTTPHVVAFLEQHPAVRDVYWSLRAGTRANYLALARTPGSVGSVVSFSLAGQLDRFYDRVRIPKGPSFGMVNSLLCPYLYLAHYDLVSTATGRADLAAHGLDPGLIRLSIGLESPDDIMAALDEALG